MIHPNLATIAYLIAGVLFILALRGLSSPETSRRGNLAGILGMTIAVGTAILQSTPSLTSIALIAAAIALGALVGAVIAKRIALTAMPQLIAAFHSLVGLAAVIVALAAFLSPHTFDLGSPVRALPMLEMSLGAAIGAITFSGSVIAFAKLQGILSGAPMLLPARHFINIILTLAIITAIASLALLPNTQSLHLFLALCIGAALLGVLIIIPIGGADMPVVVSMLNSYSGWAAAGVGFTLSNVALMITGALVGASGAILSYIMCRAMNRSFLSVILGGFGETAASQDFHDQAAANRGSSDDAAFLLKNASRVVIVPGYGMAVAQAQHSLREMVDALKAKNIQVAFAVHPVAGRMPGHMNVLLAEANIPYEDVLELEDANALFPQTDVAFVIGANDVVNPAARDDPSSPIAGMPILEVDKAKTILFVKRSLSPGYAGIDNALFYDPKSMMLLAGAKTMTDAIVKAL